ncbi:MAG TPA: GAF domain-containing protein [Anaerolineae bacterium]|nr:GAF domain-containing protein [Anaerolineae bacterium]
MSEARVKSDGQSATEIAALFQRLALNLSQIQDTELILDVILRQGQKLLEANGAAALALGEDRKPEYHVLVDLPSHAGGMLEEAFEVLFEGAPRELLSGAVVIDNLEGEDYPEVTQLRQLGVESCLVLPLAQRGDLLGGLWFLFADHHHLTKLRMSWAVVLAGQAALALENVRLVDIALRQASELGAFYETAATVEYKQDLSYLLIQIIDQTTTLLDCKMGIIYLADEEGLSLRSVVYRGIPGDPDVLTCPYGEGVAGQVAEIQEPIALDECHDWEGITPAMADRHSPVRVLCVPMMWRQRLIGVLDLAAKLERRPFSEADIRLAKSVAYQAANALGIANLIESERRQYRMAEALQEASLVISHQINLDEILDRILEQVMYAFPCDAANIQNIDGDRVRIIRHRGYDRFDLSDETLSSLMLDLEEDKYLQRLQAGEVLAVPDTMKEPSWTVRPGWDWLKSWAGAPIVYGKDILGFINLESALEDTFDEVTTTLLTAFAAHAAAAMHKAELYRRLAKEHQMLRTLYEIERAVTGSLEKNEILTRLLEGTIDAFEGIYAQVFIPTDGDEEIFKHGPKINRTSEQDDLSHHPQAMKLAEHVILELTPVHATLVYPSASYTVFAFPIVAGKQVWGSALIWTESVKGRDTAWLEVLRAAGQQVGLVLTNADQHAQVQRRLAEMTILQRVVGSIAGRLEVEALLREVADQLHNKLGFPAVQIFRRKGDQLVLEECCGPKPIVERLSIDRGITGRVARTGQPALVEDVRKDPDYVAGLVGTQAEMTVPISLGEEIVGVINIETSDPLQIDSGALELLILLADQVSVALHNAMLYEQVQESVIHLEEQVQERTSDLEKALKQAQAADQAKAKFVEEISHELRTPLTNVGLYLDLIEMGDDERHVEYMATLRRETDRLSALIEQLLAISHLDSKQVQLNPRPTDMNSLVKVLVVDRARMIGEKGLDLQVKTAEDLPLAQVDPQLIIQALTNLLTNAMNYTQPGGGIVLETKRQLWKKQPWITVMVKDTGPGISESEKKRIFDRFYRGLAGRASGVPGTGLGLSISKEIVERHGGRITLESKIGEGATFVVWLPVAKNSGSEMQDNE